MTNDPKSERRAKYPHFLAIPTRWKDIDVYGHVNNVVYYAYFDTVINEYLMQAGGLDPHEGQVVGFAVETQCQFLKPIVFPEIIDAGVRVAKLGNSSVRYEIGIFKQGEDDPCAVGYFVHVFVNRADNRPTRIEGKLRVALEQLLIDV